MKILPPLQKNPNLIFESRSAEKTIRRNVQCCAPVHDLKGKSVAVIGLGVSGRAVVKLALARGASVIAIDQNENLNLLEDPPFEKNCHLRTFLGHFNTKLLDDAGLVVLSPGVPLESHGLPFLLESNTRIPMELPGLMTARQQMLTQHTQDYWVWRSKNL